MDTGGKIMVKTEYALRQQRSEDYKTVFGKTENEKKSTT